MKRTAHSAHVGVVGAGAMGLNIAKRLALKNFLVYIYDQKQEVIRQTKDLSSMIVLDSAEAVGRVTDIVLVIVGDDMEVYEVINGSHGLRPSLSPGKLIVVHSTVSPHTIEDLADQLAPGRIEILDAAMSGGERAAENGSLTLMAGGSERNFEERLGPVFSAYATSILWLGRLGTGMTAKLINNMLLHSSRLALYESFFLSDVIGIDFADVLQVVRKSTGQSWIADNWGELDHQILERGLPGSSFLFQMQKDLGLFLDLCRSKGFTPCMATLVESVLPLIVAHGDWPTRADL